MSLLRREIACQQWVELVTDYLDGALPRRLRRAIDRHLAGCANCTEHLAQMRRTIAIAGALPADEVLPDDLLDAVRAAFAEHHRAS